MIRKVSEKRLRANGGKMYSTISKKSRIKKRPRSKSEFTRIYGSKARVLFVKSLPCAACGVVGFSDNSHVAPQGEKGTGYKAGFKWIAPLCRTHIRAKSSAWFDYQTGCHTMYDEYRDAFRKRHPDFDPVKAASDCEKSWQSHIAAPEKEK